MVRSFCASACIKLSPICRYFYKKFLKAISFFFHLNLKSMSFLDEWVNYHPFSQCSTSNRRQTFAATNTDTFHAQFFLWDVIKLPYTNFMHAQLIFQINGKRMWFSELIHCSLRKHMCTSLNWSRGLVMSYPPLSTNLLPCITHLNIASLTGPSGTNVNEIDLNHFHLKM